MLLRRVSTFPLALLLLAACTPNPAPHSAREQTDLQVPHVDERALLLLLVDRQTYDDFTVQQCL